MPSMRLSRAEADLRSGVGALLEFCAVFCREKISEIDSFIYGSGLGRTQRP